MDTGASIAPYNHIELASPFGLHGSASFRILPAPIPLFFPGSEYIWGRQLGEFTINP